MSRAKLISKVLVALMLCTLVTIPCEVSAASGNKVKIYAYQPGVNINYSTMKVITDKEDIKGSTVPLYKDGTQYRFGGKVKTTYRAPGRDYRDGVCVQPDMVPSIVDDYEAQGADIDFPVNKYNVVRKWSSSTGCVPTNTAYVTRKDGVYFDGEFIGDKSKNPALTPVYIVYVVVEKGDLGHIDSDGNVDRPVINDSEASVDVTAEVSGGGSVNYKNFTGTVGGNSTSTDTSNYENDGAKRDKVRASWNLRGSTTGNSDSGRSRSITAGYASRSFNGDESFLYSSGTTFRYYIDAEGSVELSKGNPDSANGSDTAIGKVTKTNVAPTVSWRLITKDLNGGAVPNGYYYKDTPMKLDVTFGDYENDKRMTELAIKKQGTAGASFIARQNNDSGEKMFDFIPFQMDVTDVTLNTQDGVSATLTIKEPGVYEYSLQCYDGNSDHDVSEVARANGTFVVRSEPGAPKAVINSPLYAFENEPLNVKQLSTDPNGNDDIQRWDWTNPSDVTNEKLTDGTTVEAIGASASWRGKDGGTITFPTNSHDHFYRIGLNVTDATNLSDSTTHEIKVIGNIPIADPKIVDNNGKDVVKENRKITVSASGSLAPSKSPILWNECLWTITDSNGNTPSEVIKTDTSQTNGNKQRVMQFTKPGTYKVKVKIVNQYSKDNPTHKDIAAAEAEVVIKVVEDKAPISTVSVKSAKPNFRDNPIDYTVRFGVDSASVDGDYIIPPGAYNWLVYEDLDKNGKFEESELVPQGKLTFNSNKTEVAMQTKFVVGGHNVIKAVVSSTETFAEPFIAGLLPADGSHVRKTTVQTTETVNWVPKIEVMPANEKNTPYEDQDFNGDGTADGKAVKSYTDDTFSFTTNITDELPATANVVWSIAKRDTTGVYQSNAPNGRPYMQYNKVSSTLGHDNGTLKIAESGFYKLTATVIDDCGDTGSYTSDIRIYTLPKGVLESNPKYQLGGEWRTKENVRFDLRADPTITDDEWGKAWHTMNWAEDCWEIIPLGGQKLTDIHVMDTEYKGRFNSSLPQETTKYVMTRSQLGGLLGNIANGGQPYRSISFTEPGDYEIRYWGINFGGKATVPVSVLVHVTEDAKPVISGKIAEVFLRDPDDGNRAKISLLGPYADALGRDVLTIKSPDGDYIDYTTVTVTHDSNNNKLFTDSADTKWLLEEGKTSVNGLEYELKKINTH